MVKSIRKLSVSALLLSTAFGVYQCTSKPAAVIKGVGNGLGDLWNSAVHTPSYIQSRTESERWDHETAAKAWCSIEKFDLITNKGKLDIEGQERHQNVSDSLTYSVLTQVCDRPNQATQLAIDYLSTLYDQSSIESMDKVSLAYQEGGARKDDKEVDNGEFNRMLRRVNPDLPPVEGEVDDLESSLPTHKEIFSDNLLAVDASTESQNPLLAYALQMNGQGAALGA